eukprot:CAMPEP_0197663416 /NCGR_PEP_ID=MMETSP1338-20131121/57317_1 /TAXON_ID=43686 ORGANISM="Pelagodinium beii, Strain RCC1491" /NCGR_SAMPLE_ID=MMETSP1338 /ASSEMBLY_ACC=CAM_ASM_000754 /LENGTH=62 /DNA_ID=CAMNT_0043241759 /DNA_START=145 /DNA_END=330 /DNA_ORIENTATION=+
MNSARWTAWQLCNRKPSCGRWITSIAFLAVSTSISLGVPASATVTAIAGHHGSRLPGIQRTS